MNIKAIFNVVGALLILLSGLLLLPLGVAIYFDTPPIDGYMDASLAFLLTLVLSLSIGLALWKLLPPGIEMLRDREGFAIVALSWICIALIGSFPYMLTGVCPLFIDAFFESMSGFTTTGASVLKVIDPAPKAILFWRNLTQWVGGMGIILLSLAIFPVLGIGSFHLFKAEIPGGATVERMQPRLAETAKILWKTYVILTVAEVLLLRSAGLGWFDAVCHTFSTVATGGFSPHNGSIGYFNNLYVETIIIVFMFLGGVNFALHYQLVSRNFAQIFKNPEFRFYTLMIVLCTFLAALGLRESAQEPPDQAFRKALFTVVSINTTTGFATDDFNLWPDYLRLLLLGVMMVGGCSGSTSGSLKAIRFILIFKIILRELQKLVHPRAIFHVKVSGKTVPAEDLTNVVALTFLFFGLAAAGAVLMSLSGLDLTTSVSASIATLFNIGPGLGQVGAMGDYADLPVIAKVISIAFMLLGRLEIYGILLLFLPMTWRK